MVCHDFYLGRTYGWLWGQRLFPRCPLLLRGGSPPLQSQVGHSKCDVLSALEVTAAGIYGRHVQPAYGGSDSGLTSSLSAHTRNIWGGREQPVTELTHLCTGAVVTPHFPGMGKCGVQSWSPGNTAHCCSLHSVLDLESHFPLQGILNV